MGPERDLYDDLVSRGEAAIDEMVIPPKRQEDLWLEFKEASQKSAPMQTVDLQKLAEGVSAFANSEGGVIVWGVEAHNAGNKDEPDSAQKLKPIENLSLWLSDLKSRTSRLFAPAVPVEHHAIFMAGETDKGYAATFVPKSDGLPVMAMAKDQHRYYQRTGSDTIKMEHYMLADRFSRRPQPKLRLWIRVMKPFTATIKYQNYDNASGFIVGIENVGAGIATFPALRISDLANVIVDRFGIDNNGNAGFPHIPENPDLEPYTFLFAGGLNDVIHSGAVRQIVKLTYHCDLFPAQHIGKPIEFNYELMCDGFTRRDHMSFNLGEQFPGRVFAHEAVAELT